MECPKLRCDKPLPLAPGDCCPRCPDDPCTYASSNSTTAIDTETGEPCSYRGQMYESGETFNDLSSPCTTCGCKVNSGNHCDIYLVIHIMFLFVHTKSIETRKI